MLVMGPDASHGTQTAIPPIANLVTQAVCAKKPAGYVYHSEKNKSFPAGCMAWACRACARILAYRVKERLKPIDWTAKLELTLDGDGSPTRENNLRLARGTRSLLQFVRRYFRRKYGREWKLRYARMHGVGERGGRLHSHMVWDAPFIPQEVLSEHAEACGLGFRVYIRAIDNRHGASDHAARYVAEQAVTYVSNQAVSTSEQPDLPKGARRFQSTGVPAYEAEEGWLFHKRCPWGCACKWCGTVAAPVFPRSQAERWIQYWDVDLRTGEMLPRELTLRALSSLVTNGETASAVAAINEKPPQLRFEWKNGFT